MAGKPKKMSQVKQILRMHEQGSGIKTIARNLHISKNTVRAYLAKIEKSRVATEELLGLDDPVLETRLLAGNPSYKDERYEELKGKLSHYTAELSKVGVNRKVLWDEYRETTPNAYGYSQFCYHLQQYHHSSKPTMVLQHKPGEKLYIDFAGKKLSYTDRITGEQVFVQVFVACLPYSDYSFALGVPSQQVEDFLYALGCCLSALGGVPLGLVPDNLKSAVIKANRYEPDINRALEDFANHYGATVLPARPLHPRDKSLVENQVKLIYSRVYARLRHQQFFNLADLNRAIAERIKAHNQTRMQQKDYCREEKFLSEEKHHLLALPETSFEVKYYAEYKVAKNNHIYLGCDKHYYSVPFAYIGLKAKVIYTRSLVKIYCKGQLVATHARDKTRAGYTTCKEHLCSTHRYYLDRSPAYYIGRGKTHSESLYRYIEALFAQEKLPEQLYRTCDGVLSLARKTPREEFIEACNIALENHNYSYRFLKQLLENHMTHAAPQAPVKPLPDHSNIRGAKAYR